MKAFHLTQAAALVPSSLVLTKHHYRISRYFDYARIPPSLLKEDHAVIVKRTHFWRFLDRVEEKEGITTLGFLLGEEMDLALLGPWGTYVASAGTLFEALKRAAATVPDFAQGNVISVRIEGEESVVEIRNEEMVECRTADHAGLNLLLTLVRLVADQGWHPREAKFRTSPTKDVEALEIFSRSDLQFRSSVASIRIPTEYLARSLPGPTVTDDSFQVRPLPSGNRISSKLEILLRGLLPHGGAPSADEVAELLGVSRITLFRHLAGEGESYQNLVERVRFELARDLLSRPNTSVKEIAFQLGYRAANNFTRAFRKFAGVSPTQYRALRHSLTPHLRETANRSGG